MKRLLLFLTFILLLLCSSCSAKTNADNPAYQSWLAGVRAEPTSQTTDNMYARQGAQWALSYINSLYADKNVRADTTARFLSTSTYTQYSTKYRLRPAEFEVQLHTYKETPGSVKQQDGCYLLETRVYTVAVLEGETLTLSGFLDGQKVQLYDVGEKAYEVAAADERFAGSFNPYPKSFSLPKGIKEVNVSALLGGTLLLRDSILLPNGTIALIAMGEKEWAQDGSVNFSKLLYLDPAKNKLVGQALSVEPTKLSFGFIENGTLILRIKKNGVYSNFKIENGQLVPNETIAPEDAAGVKASPSGEKIAFSRGGSLYVSKKDGSNLVRLLVGNESGDVDRQFYYAAGWANDDEILYGNAGFESQNGCGIVNVTTGILTPFESAGPNAGIEYVKGSRVFTKTYVRDGSYNPAYIDLNDRSYTSKPILSSGDLKSKFQISVYTISDDGKSVAFMVPSRDPYKESELYVCDVETGSVLKQYSFYAGFNRLLYVSFLSPNKLLLRSQNYAYSPLCFYLVDIK